MNPGLFKNFFPESVRAVFSDTSEDFVLPPGARGLSDPQRSCLKNKLDMDPSKVFTMRQVHGNVILTISGLDVPQKDFIPDADAMVTNVPGIVLSVRTADCLPVFLYDPKQRCAGLVHAGWKGTAAEVVLRTLETLVVKFGSRPEHVLAALGPAIRECCYEVGEEFEKTFPNDVSTIKNRRCFNLPLVNKKQLLNAGVKEHHILDSGFCTVCGSGFFSYRRDKDLAGRHLSLMTIVPEGDG